MWWLNSRYGVNRWAQSSRRMWSEVLLVIWMGRLCDVAALRPEEEVSAMLYQCVDRGIQRTHLVKAAVRSDEQGNIVR